jgi:hypothetical protein
LNHETILKEEYGKLPSSNKWHKELLDLNFIKTDERKELFSEKLKVVLDDYLSFRYFIRNTYSYKINWERMEYLVLNIDINCNDIKTEIINYIKQ